LTPQDLPRPKSPVSLVGIFFVGAAFMFFVGSSMFVSALSGRDSFFIGFLGIISVLIAIALIVAGIYFIPMESKSRKKREREYNQQLAERKQKLDQQKNNTLKAIKRWGLLYYCERDDCVFIPGENISASASQMNDILYK
jgi:predicted membrane protein